MTPLFEDIIWLNVCCFLAACLVIFALYTYSKLLPPPSKRNLDFFERIIDNLLYLTFKDVNRFGFSGPALVFYLIVGGFILLLGITAFNKLYNFNQLGI